MDLFVKRSIIIEKPVEEVWKILWDGTAPTFGEGIAKILSNVKATNQVFTDEKTKEITGREIAMADGSIFTEMIQKVDAENHILSYSISGIPFGIVPVGTWTVSSVEGDANKAELSVTDEATLSYWPPRFLAYPIFALMLPGVFDAMLGDIKHWAETGQPSPAKLELIKKVQASEETK